MLWVVYMNNLGAACFVVNWVLANPLAQNCVHIQSNLDSCVIYKREGQSLVQKNTCVVLHALKQLDSTSLPISLPKWVVHDSLKLDGDKAKLRSLYKDYLDIVFYYAQIGSRSHFQEFKLQIFFLGECILRSPQRAVGELTDCLSFTQRSKQ